jgi:hypothetical protein
VVIVSPGMPLIERGTLIEGIPVPRSLFGDDKIRVAVREAREIARRVEELTGVLLRARFESDPPDNDRVRQSVTELARLPPELRNLIEDLRLYTEVTPDGRTPPPVD